MRRGAPQRCRRTSSISTDEDPEVQDLLSAEDRGSQQTFRATFPHRTVTRSTGFTQRLGAEAQHDFLAFMTCAADLYSQTDVLEMEESTPDNESDQAVHSSGATSTVSTITTSYTQPSNSNAYTVRNIKQRVAIKKYDTGLFHANGTPGNVERCRSFVTELRVLCHPVLRDSREVATVLGIHWHLTTPVRVLSFTNGESPLSYGLEAR